MVISVHNPISYCISRKKDQMYVGLFLYKLTSHLEEIRTQIIAYKYKKMKILPFVAMGKAGSISSQCVAQNF